MTDEIDHTRDGVPDGQLLHASPILPGTDQTESASEQARVELLRTLDYQSTGGSIGAVTATRCAAAIRALEAKVRDSEAVARALDATIDSRDALIDALCTEAAELRADRDRLAGEVERLERVRTEQAQFCNAMVVERNVFKNAMDASMRTEARLTAELAAARENEARYLWLREGGFNLPDLPYKRQSGEERVAEIEAAIDAERLAHEEEDDD